MTGFSFLGERPLKLMYVRTHIKKVKSDYKCQSHTKSHSLHLWKFGGSTTCDLSHSKLGKFHFQVIQLLQQLLLLLPAQISGLDLCLKHKKITSLGRESPNLVLYNRHATQVWWSIYINLGHELQSRNLLRCRHLRYFTQTSYSILNKYHLRGKSEKYINNTKVITANPIWIKTGQL